LTRIQDENRVLLYVIKDKRREILTDSLKKLSPPPGSFILLFVITLFFTFAFSQPLQAADITIESIKLGD